MKQSLVLKAAFLLLLLIIITEGYFIFRLKNKPKTFSSSQTFSQSSCILFEERFCQAGKKKQIEEGGSYLLFSLPKGAKLFAPWDGIIFLNEGFYSPYEQNKKIASAHLFPPYSIIEKEVRKKRTLTIVYGENVRWQATSGALIKKGQLLGEVLAQKPLFPKDPANLAFIFSDYRGNDAQVDPKNFSQFFNLDQ